jgi:hypothetical protein
MDWNEIQRRLTEPFAAAAISWRAGSVSRDKKRAQALPYAEPRVYEDRLNNVLGPDWNCRFKTWGDQRLICELTVRVTQENGELPSGYTVTEVTHTSTGEFDNGDKIAQGTVAEAQAFKRACSKFGLGRYLYDVPVTWVGYDEGSRRLNETPTLPERFHPQPEPVEPIRLTAHRASLLHKELGRLSTIASREHQVLAGAALSRKVDGFTGLTEDEALLVLNHARSVHAQRKQRGHSNPERQGSEQRLRA